jgi:hypothetical protein
VGISAGQNAAVGVELELPRVVGTGVAPPPPPAELPASASLGLAAVGGGDNELPRAKPLHALELPGGGGGDAPVLLEHV